MLSHASIFNKANVDNNLMIGDADDIDEAITSLKENGLVLKDIEGLQDYLSCEVKISMNKMRA